MIQESKRTIHPMVLAVGAALIVVCGAGTAAIMGWLPESIGHTKDNADLAAASQAVPEKASRASGPSRARATPIRTAASERATCAGCGTIESIRVVETRGEGSGVGVVGGAVVGGLLGNQVGGGRGKDAMTVVGAVGGALAGNQIEKSVKSTTSYEVALRMDNGTDRSIQTATQPAWQRGDHVRVVDGVIRDI